MVERVEETEWMSRCEAVAPEVSFFLLWVHKNRVFMKVLKNGLYFNSVWGQSLNLQSVILQQRIKKT